MSAERTADANARLAQTRQDIATWLEAHPPAKPADAAPLSATSPNVLAGLLLIAIAEHVLKRSANVPSATSDLPHLSQAKDLLEATTRKHPIWMLGLVAALGAGFAASRPWRWFVQKDTWVKLISQVLITSATRALENQTFKKTQPTKPSE
jgi:hypothetical protein